MRYLYRYLLVTLLVFYSASGAVAADLCPKYVVGPGETLDSISAKFKLDKGILIQAIQGCGRTAAQLNAGDTICLPGSELIGCMNVDIFNSNPKCKYYVIQPGESIATIALALNLYQPDIEAANPDIIQRNLQVGDLIKLPQWNEAKCGLLPSNIQQLVVSESIPPPPPPTPKTGPPPPQKSSNIKAPATPTTFQAPPSQTDAQKCRGFRARDFDDLFSIATLFAIDVAQLVTVNPDLGGGIPVLPGVIVKIPPFDPTCSAPVLIDAETLMAPPPMNNENTQPGALLRPVNQGSGSGALPTAQSPAAAALPSSPAVEQPITTPSIEGEQLPPTTDAADQESPSAPDVGLGGADTIEADDTILQNIVRDGGNSNAPPAPQSGSNTGNIIMGTTIFVVCLVLIGMLGMAFSGTAPMRLGMKKEAAPDNMIV